MASKPGPDGDDADVAIGCLVGFVMGLVGAVVGTVALLLLRPTWIAREGDPIGTIVAGLLIGWAVAAGVAGLANVLLVALMSARERGHDRAPSRLSVALLFIVPAIVAAVTLWLAASVNR
jgi:hypothetical protein